MSQITGIGKVSMRNYFSTHLLWAAQRLGALARAVEQERGPGFDIEHRAYVLASIQSAAGFLEAMVNELYQDAHDGRGSHEDGYIAPLSGETRRLMAELWRATEQGYRMRALEKYQLLLAFAGKETLKTGAQPYQDANLLIGLRNAIVHYKPEDVSVGTPAKLEKRLRGKFPENPLMVTSGNPWWPDLCLGSGCTEWAHRVAKALADHVVEELAIRPHYRRPDGGESKE